jgi:acetyl esterase/lipase
MNAGTHNNIIVEQLKYLSTLAKSALSYKTSILKNMEMHYRSNLGKIVRKINLAEKGLFKDAFERTCP